MLSDAGIRIHSPQDPSPKAESGDLKKRRKENSGKEKHKRKRLHGRKEDADVVIERSSGDALPTEGRKKKRAKTSSNHDDTLNQSSSSVSPDRTPRPLEKKKKKRKARQQPHQGDGEPDSEAIKSPSKCGESARSPAGEKGDGHVYGDEPHVNGVKDKLSNANHTPSASLKEPASSPNTPRKDSSSTAAELSDKHVDREPTANSKKSDPKEKERTKKKKKRRKSARGEEESGIESLNSLVQPPESAQGAVERDHVPGQSKTPDASGGNGSPSAKPTSSASLPEKPSKRPLNATSEAPDQHVDGELTANSKKSDPKEKERTKKKKKRRKSARDEEESGIKPNKSPTQTGESAHNAAVKKRDVSEQNTPDATEIRHKPSSENHSPSAKQPGLASAPETPSKQPSKATAEQSEQLEDDEKPLDDKRLPRTLFVGNVAHTVTRKQLSKIFSKYSPIENIRIRNVIPANPKIPKKAALLAGRLAKFSDSFSAYVVFKETADIENVLQRAVDGTNMTILEDHHLRVTKALQTKGTRRQSVFVGNLPFDCGDEELITAFMPVAKECGAKLVNVRVNRDSDTGVGRGCGFVTFDDIMGIQACLNKAGEIKIRNRVVRLERAFKAKNMKSKSYKRKWKAAFGPRDQ